MEYLLAEQVPFDQLYIVDFDLIIAVSGYEERCTYLVDKIKTGDALCRVLAFSEKKNELSRPGNDVRFRELGFEFTEQSGNECPETEELLTEIIDSGKSQINILVDYSCMTKLWYASILNYFSTAELDFKRVSVFFSYTGALYSEPQKPGPLKIAEPIGCRMPVITSSKPVALVMGLGYEKERADMLTSSMNPDNIYVFYADPSDDQRFVEKVYINNFRLIDSLHRDQVITYPIRDLRKIDELLTDLCLDLRLEYRVILAPLGPKPFSLCCLLLAARYPDIEVWRISAGKAERPYDRKAHGEPLIYKIMFGQEEDYEEDPEEQA